MFRVAEAAIDAVIRGEPLYPSNTAFVPTDIPGSGAAVKRYRREGLPVLLAFPDGETQLLPPDGGVAAGDEGPQSR